MLCLVPVDLPGLVELEVLVSGGVVLVHNLANVAGGGAAVPMMVDTENRDSVVNILLYESDWVWPLWVRLDIRTPMVEVW